jgi:hypothetical protein
MGEILSLNELEHKNYARKLLELKNDFDNRLNTTIEWYAKQVELDKNNEDPLVVIERLQKTEYEFNERRSLIVKEYMDKASKLIPDRIGRKYPVYNKAMYLGDIKKYEGILGGFNYYIKLKDDGNIDIFDDAEFSKFIITVPYIPEEWRVHILDII